MLIALVSLSPLSAQAQSEDFQLDPTVIFSTALVFGTIAAGLSWVAKLKPKKTQDGQPRSTSLYRVFQARMRAGEFATLAEKEKVTGPEDAEDAELDAFVDAYVDALEDDSDPQEGKDSSKENKESNEKAAKSLDKKWKPFWLSLTQSSCSAWPSCPNLLASETYHVWLCGKNCGTPSESDCCIFQYI